ncbi:Protein of unknown function [Methylobacterium sp. UNC378MF]|uniref:DUF1217 domain-containing protein n=1 Tax=Methylobacterium sp. UNC378MF TaxID=1502748 RepID=UPI00087FA0EF|nr:DUF1217 domain-containing protein [Methylobacterium sp. UNC378MF]SDA11381.1 Protein of unknown function [Methylobacterium sp. UNC378MF]
MISTLADYRSITANMAKSLGRQASSTDSKKEIEYFETHIGQINTVDDFLKDNRLYTFAMKAYGLDDMIYAKGFMKKILLGEPDASGHVLVDRVQDSRYRDFAAAFNFKAFGDDPSKPKHSDNAEVQDLLDALASIKKTSQEQKADYDDETDRGILYLRDISQYITSTVDIEKDSKLSSIVRQAVGLPQASPDDDVDVRAMQLDGKVDAGAFQDPERLRQLIDQYFAARQEGRKAIVDPYFRPAGTYADSDTEIAKLTQYFRAKIKSVTSAKDVVADPILNDVVRSTLGLSASAQLTNWDAQAKQIADKLDVTTLRNPKTLDQFVARFEARHAAARTATVDAYLRQRLETEAGTENPGVRLALYFRRMAPGVRSAYGILADPALTQVVRTALGLPTEAAKISVEGQAKLIQRKLDIASLRDPDKLDQFIKRFSILWDSQNGAASSPALSLLSGGASSLDPDLLLKLQTIRQGGH